jgi:hypothetical protein
MFGKRKICRGLVGGLTDIFDRLSSKKASNVENDLFQKPEKIESPLFENKDLRWGHLPSRGRG